jgi:diguanylate cyclase
MYKEIRMLSKDDLTGVYDRTVILERLEAAARDSAALSLIFMDLDNLKRFNEEFGFQAGDEWIRGVVSLFADAFGGDDLVGRYGGDEFLAGVCFKTQSNAEMYDTYEKVDRLRMQLEKEGPLVTINGNPTRTGYTVSFGIATYPRNAGDVVDLVEKAKLALYLAKETGGNSVHVYEEKDSLTGLLSYYSGQRALEDALVEAREKRETVSILLMDIDRFKEINDDYGHRVGDEVIRRLGHILENNFKDAGTLARVGGDEFMLILPGQRADSAFVLAEEVRRLVEDSELEVRIANQKHNVRFHVTGGIANYPSDASERVDLIRKADEALYRAKRIGRNRICLPANAQMVTKTSHYTQIQLERLSTMARKQDKTEAFLLREALDDLLRKYGDDGED